MSRPMPYPSKVLERKELEWKRHGSYLITNRWPGGPRTLICLKCDLPFRSVAKDHRLCTLCRQED